MQQLPQFPLHLPMSRLPHFPSHSNDRNGNATIFTVPNVNNVHCYKLVQLAQVRITYLDPSLHLVSTLHSLGFFLCPDSSVRLCSPALTLAHLNSRPDSSIHPCSPGGKCPRSLRFFLRPDLSVCLCSPALALAHLNPFCVLPYLSMCALQEVIA